MKNKDNRIGKRVKINLSDLYCRYGKKLCYTSIKDKSGEYMLYARDNVFIADEYSTGVISDITKNYVDVTFTRESNPDKRNTMAYTIKINVTARLSLEEAEIGLKYEE